MCTHLLNMNSLIHTTAKFVLLWWIPDDSPVWWTFHCFPSHIGTVLKGDQVVTAELILPAKEVHRVNMPRMFPQALLQINPLVFSLCSVSRMSWTRFLLWNAFIGEGCLTLAGTKCSPWISFKEECASCKSSACSLIFPLQFQWHYSHYFVKRDPCTQWLEVCQLNRPGAAVSTTRFFQGGILTLPKVQMIPAINHLINLINHLQLNFWWHPLHLFYMKCHTMSLISKCVHWAVWIIGSLAQCQLLQKKQT